MIDSLHSQRRKHTHSAGNSKRYSLLDSKSLRDNTYKAKSVSRPTEAEYRWQSFTQTHSQITGYGSVKRMRRMGYRQSSTPDVEDLGHAAEDRLLGVVVVNSNHVLGPLFHQILFRRPGLRPRPHNFTLPLHLEITIILFPEFGAVPFNLHLLIT